MSFEPDLNQRPMDILCPLQSTALPTELSSGDKRLREGGKRGKKEEKGKGGKKGEKKGEEKEKKEEKVTNN